MRFRLRFESLETRENPSAVLAPDVPLPDPLPPSGPVDPGTPPPPPTNPDPIGAPTIPPGGG